MKDKDANHNLLTPNSHLTLIPPPSLFPPRRSINWLASDVIAGVDGDEVARHSAKVARWFGWTGAEKKRGYFWPIRPFDPARVLASSRRAPAPAAAAAAETLRWQLEAAAFRFSANLISLDRKTKTASAYLILLFYLFFSSSPSRRCTYNRVLCAILQEGRISSKSVLRKMN